MVLIFAEVKGSNLRVKVSLSIDDINGVDKKIKVKEKNKHLVLAIQLVNLNAQAGSRVTNTILGRMQSASTYTTCNGSGEMLSFRPSGSDSHGLISQEDTISIKIPAGVEERMQLKVSGKGNDAPEREFLVI